MTRRLLTTARRFGLGALLFLCSAVGCCAEEPFTKWAAAHAIPITSLDPASNDSDLLAIEPAIRGVHVVAFGEPLHGAHEPLAFRNRLFRFLVERMEFTAIALESGFTESLNARSYIEAGAGDAETAMRTGLSSSANEYPENRELIQWMRDYNATATSTGHRKIHLYGIDLPNDARPSGPRRTLDYALTFLARADPTTAEQIRASLSDGLPSTDEGGYRALSAAAQTEFETDISAIAKAMQTSRTTLIARSSDEQYRWAMHNLDTARQLARCLPMTPPQSAGPSPWVATFECRDSAMAKNVQWTLEQEGRHGRLLVFAHNGHVMSWKEEGPRWGDAPGRPSMMGLYLRQVYGKDIYIIAMSSATTSAGLPTAKSIDPDSIDRVLTDIGPPLMLLDVRSGQGNREARDWLSTQRSMNANINIDFRLTPATAVDAFSFVKTLTASIQPPAKSP